MPRYRFSFVGPCASVVGGLVLALATSLALPERAHAQSDLPPGTTTGIAVPTITVGTPPFGDTLMEEIQAPIYGSNGTNTISGTITSAAFHNSSGYLDFAYQFSFDTSTNIDIDAISIASFHDVGDVEVAQTSEDLDGSGLAASGDGGTIQNDFVAGTDTGSFSSASRPNINGDGINATLDTGVTGGQNTFAFVLRTDQTQYEVAGSASVEGGGISAFTALGGAITPIGTAAAPEPDALWLMALGLMPSAWFVRKRSKSL